MPCAFTNEEIETNIKMKNNESKFEDDNNAITGGANAGRECKEGGADGCVSTGQVTTTSCTGDSKEVGGGEVPAVEGSNTESGPVTKKMSIREHIAYLSKMVSEYFIVTVTMMLCSGAAQEA